MFSLIHVYTLKKIISKIFHDTRILHETQSQYLQFYWNVPMPLLVCISSLLSHQGEMGVVLQTWLTKHKIYRVLGSILKKFGYLLKKFVRFGLYSLARLSVFYCISLTKQSFRISPWLDQLFINFSKLNAEELHNLLKLARLAKSRHRIQT